MDFTIDRLSDASIGKHYLPSICSPVATMADPWGNAVDRGVDASRFFRSCSCMLF